MKKNLTVIFVLAVSSCFSQQIVQKKIIPQLKTLLENKKTDIRSLLDIDGYYQIKVSFFDKSESTSDYNIMFFDDGTFTSNFGFKENLTENQIKPNMSRAVRRWDVEGKNKWKGYWGGYWGTYRIEGDTIIGQFLREGTWITEWIFYEERYKVINRITFEIICIKSLLKDNPYKKDPCDLMFNFSLARFVPADSLPSSDCWLKEEKWIWRNESDWRDYMEKIKQKKKK